MVESQHHQNKNIKILVTGGSGFVGSSLIEKLLIDNYSVTAHYRSKPINPDKRLKTIFEQNISSETDWHQVINDVDVIIHTVARVHILQEHEPIPLDAFRRENVESTLNLAKQAADAGVGRFIFLSTIGVNGKSSEKPFIESDNPMPHDFYAISKYEAEQGLLELSQRTGMVVVIIRPPLVYGPGVKANFLALVKFVTRKIRLPFPALNNTRSLIALENLVDLLICCVHHPKAANEIFLISDGEDVSTSELVSRIVKSFDKKPWLIRIPIKWMQRVASLLGKESIAIRLFGNLQVDSSKARNLLGWKPVITMDEQLKKMADAYIDEKSL